MNDRNEIELSIKRIRRAFENNKVYSVDFNRDGSGAAFHIWDPYADHGCPCDIYLSLSMPDAITAISGFRMKQHEFITCF